jgi:hypothetical protein
MTGLRLIERKECWALTIRGWIALFVGAVIIIALTMTSVYPFLAVDHAVRADILVVEGWLPDYALEKAREEFRKRNYRIIITTGGPIEVGFYISKHKSYAALTAATLKRLGFNEESIAVVPTPRVTKDRTYASALALKNWLLESGLSSKAFNIYSFGPHARRSRLLFKKAFGNRIEIGVLKTDSHEYDPQYWWKTSSGVRSVVYEFIAYCYARFFFYPKSETP